MTTLQRLLGGTVATVGNKLGLPEMNISERITGTYQPAGPQTVLAAQTAARPIPNGISPPYGGTATTGITGGRSGGAAPAGPTLPANPGYDPAGAAQNQLQQRLAAIQQRLGIVRDSARGLADRARSYTGELTENIGNTYNTLRQEGQNKLGTILGRLGQEQLDTENLYGRKGAEARAAFAGAEKKNRMLARMSGSQDSSFYTDRQGNIATENATTQSGLGQELAGKVSGIGTRKTEAANDFDVQEQKLNQEEAGLKIESERQLKEELARASEIEATAGIDVSEDIDAAYANHEARLAQIDDRIQSTRMNILGMLAGNQQTTRDFINNYSAFNPVLERILGQNAGLQRADNAQNVIASNTFSAPGASNGGLLANIGRRMTPEEEARYRLLGVSATA